MEYTGGMQWIGRVQRGVVVAWIVLSALSVAAQTQAVRDPAGALWEHIASRRDPTDSNDETAARIAFRRETASLAASYLAQFPGGARCDDATALRLGALFEIGTLLSGDYAELEAALRELAHGAMSDRRIAEISYYTGVLLQAGYHPRGAPPSNSKTESAPSDPLCESDRRFAEMVRVLLRASPGDAHTRALALSVVSASPAHVTLRDFAPAPPAAGDGESRCAAPGGLAAAARRMSAVGHPVELRGFVAEIADPAALRGRLLAIVFWTARDGVANEQLGVIERIRRDSPRLSVIGVNLDWSRSQLATAATALGVGWPEHFDGLGLGSPIAVEWGVWRTPFVLAIRADGALAGWADGADCAALVRRLVDAPD